MGSNVVISLLRKVIPDKVRIPAYITIISGFVTIVQMLIKAYLPAIDKQLGIFYTSYSCKLYHTCKSGDVCKQERSTHVNS